MQKEVVYYHGGCGYTVWWFTPKGIINGTNNKLAYSNKELLETPNMTTLHREYSTWWMEVGGE